MLFLTKEARTLQIACLLGVALWLPALTSGAQPVTKIAAGSDFSLLLKSDGSLWIVGRYRTEETGSGPGTNRPQLIVASNVTAMAAGFYHSLFLKRDGSLWSLGLNGFGQLGNGVRKQDSPYGTDRPQLIAGSNVTAIAAGMHHSLFLKADGSLWGMGDNNAGQLGSSIFRGTNCPQLIMASNVTAIAAGGNHSLFLENDGSLWAMGEDYQGELGDGNSGMNKWTNVPEQIVDGDVTVITAGPVSSLFIKTDGSLWGMGFISGGQSRDRPQPIATDVTAVAAGWNHSLFLKRDGSLWGLGLNAQGELGDGTLNAASRPEEIVAKNVTAIAASAYHSLFLQEDGSLWAMGDNRLGQFGDGTFSGGANQPEQVLAAPRSNIINGQLLTGSLAFSGYANAHYALDRSFTQIQPDWIPQVTNFADSSGALVFTNLPYPATNIFWRIRFVE